MAIAAGAAAYTLVEGAAQRAEAKLKGADEGAKAAASDFKAMQAGMEEGAEGLEKVAKHAQAAHLSLAQLHDKLRDQAATFGRTNAEIEVYAMHLKKIGEKQANQIGRIRQYEKELELMKERKKEAEDQKQIFDDLNEKIATFGMTKGQSDLYKLGKAGASGAQLYEAGQLIAQLNAMEDQKKELEEIGKAWEKMGRDAAQAINEIPWEKFQNELDKIDTLEQSGLLNMVQADFLRNKLNNESLKNLAHDHKPNHEKPEHIAALERRFTAGFDRSETTRQQQLAESQKQIEKNTANTAKYAEKAAKRSFVVVTL